MYCWQLAWGGCFYKHLVGQKTAQPLPRWEHRKTLEKGCFGAFLRATAQRACQVYSAELSCGHWQKAHSGRCSHLSLLLRAVRRNCSMLTSTWNSWAPGISRNTLTCPSSKLMVRRRGWTETVLILGEMCTERVRHDYSCDI